MDATQIAHNIRLAKADNARWLDCAQRMMMGEQVGKACIPSHQNSSPPYSWLYEHSSELNQLYNGYDNKLEVDLFHFEIIEQIEMLRFTMDENCLKIYKLCFPQRKNSFFFNLFHRNKKITKFEAAEAQRYFQNMQQAVEALDAMLDHLEQSFGQLCKLTIS
ncbi:hypothetical protein [Sulfurimonas sp. HSL3-7]|uniref:hypothetical protein n=1 Tax=Sulfonitrofixus jiaomeiensis TaxID=3131938 RepID=UPI0031FA4027